MPLQKLRTLSPPVAPAAATMNLENQLNEATSPQQPAWIAAMCESLKNHFDGSFAQLRDDVSNLRMSCAGQISDLANRMDSLDTKLDHSLQENDKDLKKNQDVQQKHFGMLTGLRDEFDQRGRDDAAVLASLQEKCQGLEKKIQELESSPVSGGAQVNLAVDPTDPELNLWELQSKEGELMMGIKKGEADDFQLDTMRPFEVVAEINKLCGKNVISSESDIFSLRVLPPTTAQKAKGFTKSRLIVRLKNPGMARMVAAAVRAMYRESKKENGPVLHRSGALQVFLNQPPAAIKRDILKSQRIAELKSHNKPFAFGVGGVLLVDGKPYNCNNQFVPDNK